MKLNKYVIFFCSLIIIIPTSSFALLITGSNGTEGIASFKANISYSPESADSSIAAKMTIEITNTTENAKEYIVAFAFNNPKDKIKTVVEEKFLDNFNIIGGRKFKDGIDADVFGQFDIGASIDADWLAIKGLSETGIAPGESGTFEFLFTGSGLNGFNEQDFVDSLSNKYDEQWGAQFFAVRFKGSITNSDMVPGSVGTPVPEPPTMLLVGAGLIGLAGLGRKNIFKKKKKN